MSHPPDIRVPVPPSVALKLAQGKRKEKGGGMFHVHHNEQVIC